MQPQAASTSVENTSGQGRSAMVPPEVRGWSWGAFLLTWIWGVGNNTFIALLMFVPLVNFVMPFVLGAKGKTWAWRNKRWASIEEFQRVQRIWALSGVGLIGLAIAGIVALAFIVMVTMKSTAAYQLSMEALQADPEVTQLLGTPLDGGLPSGGIRNVNGVGVARLSFEVSGPKGRGTVHVAATRDGGPWTIDRLTLEPAGSKRSIDVVGEGPFPPEPESASGDDWD